MVKQAAGELGLRPQLVVASSQLQALPALEAQWPQFDCVPEAQAQRYPRLILQADGLSLQVNAQGTLWQPAAFSRRDVHRNSLLARATGVSAQPGLTVLDAMAGWGSDGLELASLGAQVTLAEAAPLVWALLCQRVDRSQVPVEVVMADGWEMIERGGWEVILLDPMFPERGRKGLAKLPMQTLKHVAHAGGPVLEAWITHARRHARSRVVVKRRRTERVEGHPDWQIEGRTIRFDVYRPERSIT